MKKVVVLSLVLSFFLQTQSAKAAPLTVFFTGDITGISDPHNILGGSVTVGNLFSGSYNYETTAPDLLPGDPITGFYDFTSAPNGISATLNGITYETDSSNVDFEATVQNNVVMIINPMDVVFFESKFNLPIAINGFPSIVITSIGISLVDSTATALANDSLLPGAPNLFAFGTQRQFFITGCDLDTLHDFTITGRLLTAEVPEPATGLLLASGLLLAHRRRRAKH